MPDQGDGDGDGAAIPDIPVPVNEFRVFLLRRLFQSSVLLASGVDIPELELEELLLFDCEPEGAAGVAVPLSKEWTGIEPTGFADTP
jgi:hypothetical protein